MAVDNLRQTQYDYVSASYGVGIGHNQSNPLIIAETSLGHVILESVTVLWPRGGLWVVGFQLMLAGAQIVPQGTGLTFATGDDHEHEYIVGLEVDTGLQVALYNLGSFFHNVYVTYKTSTIGVDSNAPTGGAPSALGAGGGASVPSSSPTPITVLPPPPTPPPEVPPVSTITLPTPTTDPNVAALQQAVADLQTRVAALEATVAALQSTASSVSSAGPTAAAGGTQPAPPTGPPTAVQATPAPVTAGVTPVIPAGGLTQQAFNATLVAQAAANQAAGVATAYPSTFIASNGTVYPSEAAWIAAGRP